MIPCPAATLLTRILRIPFPYHRTHVILGSLSGWVPVLAPNRGHFEHEEQGQLRRQEGWPVPHYADTAG
jgi:hypothetical protein